MRTFLKTDEYFDASLRVKAAKSADKPYDTKLGYYTKVAYECAFLFQIPDAWFTEIRLRLLYFPSEHKISPGIFARRSVAVA